MSKRYNTNGDIICKIREVIKSHPNYSIEDIGHELGLSTKEVINALKKLSKIASKRVKKQRTWSVIGSLNYNRKGSALNIDTQDINEKCQKIIEAIRNDPKISEIDISRQLHLTLTEVKNLLDKLSREGKIIILSQKERRRRFIDPFATKRKKRKLKKPNHFGRRPLTEHGRSAIRIGPTSPRHS